MVALYQRDGCSYLCKAAAPLTGGARHSFRAQAALKQLSRQLVHLRERQHHLREDLRADPANARCRERACRRCLEAFVLPQQPRDAFSFFLARL